MRFVIFAVIVCFFFVGASAEFDEFKKLLDTCTKKLQADPEAVAAAYEDGQTDDPQVKCVLACTMQEEGSMNAAGEVDKDKMLELWPADAPDEMKDKLKDAVNECADNKDENECLTAYQIFTCIHSKLGFNEE